MADTALTLEAAATSGDPVARYQLALQRIEAGDMQGGLTLMRRAAEQGVPDAQFRYGRMLERGEGISADSKLAGNGSCAPPRTAICAQCTRPA